MTTAVLNTELAEVENKILDYDIIPEFNKLGGTIFDTKLKWANLVTDNHANVVSWCANRNKEQIEKLQTLDLN